MRLSAQAKAAFQKRAGEGAAAADSAYNLPMTTIRRRSRAEIDRRYLFADIFRKTGGAAILLVVLIAAGTPLTVREAFSGEWTQYALVMSVMGVIGVALMIIGRALRRQTSHYDRD